MTKYEETNYDKNSLRPMKTETCIPDITRCFCLNNLLSC